MVVGIRLGDNKLCHTVAMMVDYVMAAPLVVAVENGKRKCRKTLWWIHDIFLTHTFFFLFLKRLTSFENLVKNYFRYILAKEEMQDKEI